MTVSLYNSRRAILRAVEDILRDIEEWVVCDITLEDGDHLQPEDLRAYIALVLSEKLRDMGMAHYEIGRAIEKDIKRASKAIAEARGSAKPEKRVCAEHGPFTSRPVSVDHPQSIRRFRLDVCPECLAEVEARDAAVIRALLDGEGE